MRKNFIAPKPAARLIETIGGLLDLAWAVETEVAKPAPVSQGNLDDGLTGAAATHAERIRELLRIGYVRGIEQEIRQLAAQPGTGPLAEKLYACLDRFDLPGLARILEEC